MTKTQLMTELKVHLKTRFLNEEAILIFGVYKGGAPALQAISTSGEPLMRITVNIDNRPASNCIFIKDWSENEGIIDCLNELGLIKSTNRFFRTGFVVAKEYKLKGDLKQLWSDYLDRDFGYE